MAFLTHDSREVVSAKTGEMYSGKCFAVVFPIETALKLASQSKFLRKHSMVEGEENMIVDPFGSLVLLSHVLQTVS